MKLPWVIVAAIAATSVSCGKPQPREVRELRLDDNPVALKTDSFDALMSRAGAICDFAEFFQTAISSEESAERTVVSTRTSISLDDLVQETARSHQSQHLNPEVVPELKTLLNSLRDGWKIAVLYFSDTAPESKISSFATYVFRKVTLSPQRIECLTQAAVSTGNTK